MKYTQRAEPCKTHGGCTVIYGLDGSRAVSESHLPQEVPPETRVNLDHPEVRQGNRKIAWRLIDEDHLEVVLGGPHYLREHRRHIAYAASARSLIDRHDAADAVGVSTEALEAEAVEKGWAKGDRE